jgi:hypothetical protein
VVFPLLKRVLTTLALADRHDYSHIISRYNQLHCNSMGRFMHDRIVVEIRSAVLELYASVFTDQVEVPHSFPIPTRDDLDKAAFAVYEVLWTQGAMKTFPMNAYTSPRTMQTIMNHLWSKLSGKSESFHNTFIELVALADDRVDEWKKNAKEFPLGWSYVADLFQQEPNPVFDDMKSIFKSSPLKQVNPNIVKTVETIDLYGKQIAAMVRGVLATEVSTVTRTASKTLSTSLTEAASAAAAAATAAVPPLILPGASALSAAAAAATATSASSSSATAKQSNRHGSSSTRISSSSSSAKPATAPASTSSGSKSARVSGTPAASTATPKPSPKPAWTEVEEKKDEEFSDDDEATAAAAAAAAADDEEEEEGDVSSESTMDLTAVPLKPQPDLIDLSLSGSSVENDEDMPSTARSKDKTGKPLEAGIAHKSWSKTAAVRLPRRTSTTPASAAAAAVAAATATSTATTAAPEKTGSSGSLTDTLKNAAATILSIGMKK